MNPSILSTLPSNQQGLLTTRTLLSSSSLSVRTRLVALKVPVIFIYIGFLAHLYKSTGRAKAVTTASASASASALLKMLKFWIKVFKNLYLEPLDGSSCYFA